MLNFSNRVIGISPRLNNGHIFDWKSGIINVSRSAAPKLALVPASRYNWDKHESYLNIFAKVH